MISITKYFSILVAAGHGERCNQLRQIIHNHSPEIIPNQATLLFRDIDDYFFSLDLSHDKLRNLQNS